MEESMKHFLCNARLNLVLKRGHSEVERRTEDSESRRKIVGSVRENKSTCINES